MSLAWLFARRYLLSRKSTNAINIISIIAAMAIGVGTMALILVLSVFNGFESLVISLYNVFYPELVVVPANGKTFSLDELPLQKIRNTPGVQNASLVLIENALVEYNEKQSVVTLKGVDTNYHKVVTGLDSFIVAGSSKVVDGDREYALVGAGIAYNLGINTDNAFYSLDLYMPRKDAASLSQPENAFRRLPILPGGVFSVQQDFDTKYILVPLSFMNNLVETENTVSQVELGIVPGADILAVKESLISQLGPNFIVKDRAQQNDTLYKVMRTEKWVVFAVLLFIIVISAFNIIGALSMLVLEKQNDMAVMLAMGATPAFIKRIFLAEGCLLAGTGAVIGIVMAIILCLLQQYVGLIPMPGKTFLIKYYPVDMQAADFAWVALAVVVVSGLASWAPASRVARQAEEVIASMKRF